QLGQPAGEMNRYRIVTGSISRSSPVKHVPNNPSGAREEGHTNSPLGTCVIWPVRRSSTQLSPGSAQTFDQAMCVPLPLSAKPNSEVGAVAINVALPVPKSTTKTLDWPFCGTVSTSSLLASNGKADKASNSSARVSLRSET